MTSENNFTELANHATQIEDQKKSKQNLNALKIFLALWACMFLVLLADKYGYVDLEGNPYRTPLLISVYIAPIFIAMIIFQEIVRAVRTKEKNKKL